MTATARTLADPMFASIFNTAVVEPYDADAVRQALINHGEKIMNAESSTHIQCDTTEEHSHPSTTIHTSSVDSMSTNAPTPNQPIQGVSGAQYAPMDTSPQPPEQQQNARIKMLMEMLNTALNGLVKELQTPSQPQTDLEEAVNTALEQADWFRGRLSDEVSEYVEEHDFDYEIGNNVERYMRNVFDPNDHVDFYDLVSDAVDDKLESLVEEKLEALLEEKLANARITVNF